MKSLPVRLVERHEVEIFNEERKSLGIVFSLHEAAKKCKIKHSSCIWRYLFIKRKFSKAPVKSTITGKRYHFKLK